MTARSSSLTVYNTVCLPLKASSQGDIRSACLTGRLIYYVSTADSIYFHHTRARFLRGIAACELLAGCVPLIEEDAVPFTN
jgi:hypothetical protein